MMSDGIGGSFWTVTSGLPFWGLSGNSGTDPNANFIGTTDNQPLRFRTNGAERLEIGTGGKIRILNTSSNIMIGGTNLTGGGGGSNNVLIGDSSGGGTMTGNNNVAVGNSAYGGGTSGAFNVAIGYYTMNSSSGISGGNNVAIGNQSMLNSTSGTYNTAIGSFSQTFNTMGARNVSLGGNSLGQNTTGNNNVAIGYDAGNATQTVGANIPSNNIIIGYDIDLPNVSGSNQLNIGNLLFGTGIDGTSTNGMLSTGNIGIGVTNPQEKLHVAGSLRIVDGTEAAGRFLRSDANGSTSWVDVGTISVDEISDADGDTRVQTEESPNENYIRFDTAGAERMVIDNTGNIGINTTNPADDLEVQGTVRVSTTATSALLLRNDDNFNHGADNNIDFGIDTDAWVLSSRQTTFENSGIFGDSDFVTVWAPADSNRMIRFVDEDLWTDNDGDPYNNSAEIAYVDAAGQFVQASDKNRKQNIRAIQNALNKIGSISGYTYQYKLSASERQKGQTPVTTTGVLAQELAQVLPEAVQINQHGEYFVHYAGIIPLLIEGIKEQQQIIQQQQQELDRLKKLEDRIKKLEALVD